MADPGFKGHDRKPEVTRKDRLKFLMREFRGEVSESEVGIADRTIELVLEIDKS